MSECFLFNLRTFRHPLSESVENKHCFAIFIFHWRRGRDSNPRWSLPTVVFKTTALDHYATSPQCTCRNDKPLYRIRSNIYYPLAYYNIYSRKIKNRPRSRLGLFLVNLCFFRYCRSEAEGYKFAYL